MNSKHEWFKLKKLVLIFLFIYLLITLILSFCFLCVNLMAFKDDSKTIFLESLLCGIFSSLLGSSIFYIRKLYKACINCDIVSPETAEDFTRQIGIFFYFFLRPVFSACFSLMLLILFKSGISILSDATGLKYNFFYFHLTISFIIGYSSGDLIDKLEEVGKSLINKVSNL